MKGTEKQIAFAKDLVKEFDEIMDSLIAECPEQYKAMWIGIKEKTDAIFSEAYAGDVIDILKGRNHETNMKYFISFKTSVELSCEPTAKKIREAIDYLKTHKLN